MHKISYALTKYLLAILFSCLCNIITHGQDNSFKFRRLTINDGLSQSSVHSIVQDQEGYIWLGTSSGLNRYDGYEFKVYKNEIGNDSSLSNNLIEKLFIDSKNRLWVGTEGGGLNLFNAQSGSFIQIPLKPGESLGIKAIYEDMDGFLWLGTRNGGLFKVERYVNDSFSVTSLPVIPDTLLVENDINDIVFYQNKLILGTSGRGIIYFDSESEKFSEYYHTHHNDLLRNCVVNSFYTDKQNNLWIATDDVGMFVMQSGFEKITHFDFENFGDKGLLANNIYALTEDRLGFLWVGTKGGLNVSEMPISDYESFGSLSFTQHVFSPSNQKSLSNNFVLSIFEDQSGLLWIGTSADGVNLFNRGSELFNYFQKVEGLPNSLENETIMSVYDDEKGILWIGSDAGLAKFDKHKKTFKNFWNEVEDVSFKYNTILSVTELEYGKLLLGTYGGGLVIFDQFKEEFTLLVNDDYTDLNLNQRILTTHKDRHGNIWVGTDGDGIVKFKYENNIREIKFTQYKYVPGDTNSVSHNDIWKFYEDIQGTFWIGTAGGLNRYHPDEERFTHYRHIANDRESLSSNRVYCINNLDSGRLLIGTDNGLNIFEKTSGKFEYLTEKDGLPNHVIYGILAEDDNYFWLSTNNGISRFDHRGRNFKNYSTIDGLPSNEFNTGAYFKNASGEMFFGSTKGLVWFNPARLGAFTNTFIPPVVFSEIEVKGLGKIPHLSPPEPLTLEYNQNTVTISFTALDFTSPSKNQYAYKLDQQSQDWTFIGNRRFVTFSNLRPGYYNFQVKGSNNDGIWNETSAALHFIILAPWWQSWWVYSLYVLMAFSLIVILRHYELNRIKLRQRAAHLSELDAFKSRFYTNFTHEFRTPLTVIIGMADILKTKNMNREPVHAGESIELIQRNSKNLLRLVNEMLDLSKLESGNMELQLVQADIIPFVKYVCESFQSLANEAHIRLTVYSEVDELFIDFDPDKFSIIISNLISNALKFTQRQGNVVVHFDSVKEHHDELFIVKIKDNGRGISDDALPYIFDRFYQADTSHAHNMEGTGIGLSLTKELVELMKGTITVKSKADEGSEFTIRIPVNRNAPKKSGVYPKDQTFASVSESTLNFISPEYEDDLPLALIIEDNVDVTLYLKACLDKKYKILHAKDGISGIEKAVETIPDIIICDVMMPGKDGFEVCSTLKADERTDHVPIIMLTAKATIEDRLTGLSQGADAYLTKPFVKDELFTRLDQLVALRRKLIKKFEKDGLSQIIKQRPRDKETRFIREAVKTIYNSIDNDEFGATHLARELHLSESQLYRKLKALSGKSTAVFIRSVRLQKARELILTTDKTIAEIAYDVGFNDPSWFGRAYKEEFGSTPKETRNR